MESDKIFHLVDVHSRRHYLGHAWADDFYAVEAWQSCCMSEFSALRLPHVEVLCLHLPDAFCALPHTKRLCSGTTGCSERWWQAREHRLACIETSVDKQNQRCFSQDLQRPTLSLVGPCAGHGLQPGLLGHRPDSTLAAILFDSVK